MANQDENLFLWINSLAGSYPPVDWLLQLIASDYLIPVSLVLALFAIWFAGSTKTMRQNYQIGVFVALTSMALSSLTVLILNQFYFRPRPFEALFDEGMLLLFYPPTDSSFPSNATAAVFGIAFSVWNINRRIGLGLIIMASIYGFARIFVGVHYPLDILGGIVISLLITLLVVKLKDLLKPLLEMVLKMLKILCLA